jgi:ADP-heptose:LPS heptosyltransferase
MKILIIRFSSIGDIVLTTPVIRCLKQQLNAEIHYLTKPNFASILNSNPYIDKLHVLDKSLIAKAKELQPEKYDYVIDLHNNLRTLIFKTTLGVTAYAFPKLNFEKWLLVNFKINKIIPPRRQNIFLD